MCKEKLFLDAPCLGELEKKYLCDAIDSGYVSSVGPFVTEFEQKMAAYLGVEDAVAVVNGTSAIYAVLHELGIGKNDEVIVHELLHYCYFNKEIRKMRKIEFNRRREFKDLIKSPKK